MLPIISINACVSNVHVLLLYRLIICTSDLTGIIKILYQAVVHVCRSAEEEMLSFLFIHFSRKVSCLR